MKVIGFIGPAGCGKTTLSKHLVNNIPNSISLSFSDTMRNFISHLFPIDPEKLINEKDQYTTPEMFWQGEHLTYGRLQQVFGTEIGRGLSKNVWVHHLENKLVYLLTSTSTPPVNLVIIDSIRFLNEAGMLRNYGARLIKLTRPGNAGSRKQNHQSETEMAAIQPDYELDNSNLEDIEKTVLGIIS